MIVFIEMSEKPRQEDRGIVHVYEDLTIASRLEFGSPATISVRLKIRQMLFQSRASDTHNRHEPVRPDQAIEGNARQLGPRRFSEPLGVGGYRVVKTRIFVGQYELDFVGFLMGDLKAGGIADVQGFEDIAAGASCGALGLRHLDAALAFADQAERVRRSEQEPPKKPNNHSGWKDPILENIKERAVRPATPQPVCETLPPILRRNGLPGLWMPTKPHHVADLSLQIAAREQKQRDRNRARKQQPGRIAKGVKPGF